MFSCDVHDVRDVRDVRAVRAVICVRVFMTTIFFVSPA